MDVYMALIKKCDFKLSQNDFDNFLLNGLEIHDFYYKCKSKYIFFY